jgi:hypothetical protein
MTPSSRSTRDHLSAHTSPRRMPVVITSQTSVPQSSSISKAASTSLAAIAGDGGSGCGGFCFGL